MTCVACGRTLTRRAAVFGRALRDDAASEEESRKSGYLTIVLVAPVLWACQRRCTFDPLEPVGI